MATFAPSVSQKDFDNLIQVDTSLLIYFVVLALTWSNFTHSFISSSSYIRELEAQIAELKKTATAASPPIAVASTSTSANSAVFDIDTYRENVRFILFGLSFQLHIYDTFIHSFIHSCIHLLIYSFIHVLICLMINGKKINRF